VPTPAATVMALRVWRFSVTRTDVDHVAFCRIVMSWLAG
jgi:hypothetical protein